MSERNGRGRAKGTRPRPGRRTKPPPDVAPQVDGDGEAPARPLSVAELPRETIAWLLPGLIPMGNITILEGRKDAGKSALCCAIAAAVTGGPPLPGCRRRPPRGVLWFAAEEHVPSTTGPKLEAAGCDLAKVLCPGWDFRGHQSERWVFPGQADELSKLVADTGAALVVLDTLDSFCAAGLSMYIPQQARQYMEPLTALAGERGCAIVAIRHLRKDASGHAQDQGLGAGSITAVARSVIRLDTLAEPPGLRALWKVAGNLGEEPRPLTLRLVERPPMFAVKWEGAIDADDDRLDLTGYDPVEADTLGDAKKYIADRLREGKVPAKDMIHDGKDLGFSTDKLFRARKALGASSVAKGGRGNRVWYWQL